MATKSPPFAGARHRRLVDDALLQPHRRKLERDGLVDVHAGLTRLAEEVDRIDGEGDLVEPRVDLLAEDLAPARPHRHDAVAVGFQVHGNAVRRPVGIGREPHHGDGPDALEKGLDLAGAGILESHGPPRYKASESRVRSG